METVQFILEGYCEGAYPVDGLEEVLEEKWYAELLFHIKNEDFKNAIMVAKDHFAAEFNTENVSVFEDNDIRYVKTLSTNLSLPYIENDGDNDIAMFKWIGGHFLMEAPREIVEKWLITLDNGVKAFDQDRFDEWLGTDDTLQDGCCYNLGAAWYDLEGFGENGCSVYADSISKGIEGRLDTILGDLKSAQDRQEELKRVLLERLPSSTPLVGEELRLVSVLLEEESPASERRPDRQDVVEKWSKLAGYAKPSDFLGALFAL